MSTTNSSGSMQFWADGVPFAGVWRSSAYNGGLQFWIDGTPGSSLPTINQSAVGAATGVASASGRAGMIGAATGVATALGRAGMLGAAAGVASAFAAPMVFAVGTASASSMTNGMAAAFARASTSFSWDYDVCVPRTYRVQGQCKPSGSKTGCADPCDSSSGSSNSQQFVANVTGCSVEDVCRKLSDKNFIRQIKTVHVFNQPVNSGDPLFGPGDPNCQFDVTPSVSQCQQCCDFLVDEDHTASVRVVTSILRVFPAANGGGSGSSSGSNVVQGRFTSVFRLRVTAQGSMRLASQSSSRSSHYVVAVHGSNVVVGAVKADTSHYVVQATGVIRLGAGVHTDSSHYLATVSGRLNFSSKMTYRFHIATTVRGVNRLLSSTTVHNKYHYVASVTGKNTIVGLVTTDASHRSATVKGANVVSSRFTTASNFYTATAGGSIRISSKTRLGYASPAKGSMIVHGGMTVRPRWQATASGSMALTSKFRSTSPNYSYTVRGVNIYASRFVAINSNQGLLSFVAKVTTEADQIGAVFAATPAPALVTAISLVATDCCTIPMPSLLVLRHNLNGLLALNRFLLRNGLTLPGVDTDLSFQYRPRFGSWQANLHFVGSSAEYNGQESWDILFDLTCSVDPLGVQQWAIAIVLTRDFLGLGQKFVSRILNVFDPLTLCGNGSSFTGFSFTFNLQNRISDPSGMRLGIFYDEASLFLSSPSFIDDPNLSIQIVPSGAARDSMPIVDLEEQRQATSHIADLSGHPL